MTRREIEWPEDEPIPNTLEEALAMGWRSQGPDTAGYGTEDTDALQRGHVELLKTVKVAGMQIELSLEVSFTATVTFDRPGSPQVWEDTGPLPDHLWKAKEQ